MLVFDGVAPGETVGIDGVDACLVPNETHMEWTSEGKRWKLSGDSLCIENSDKNRTRCYGLTNLRRAEITNDGTTVKLNWEADDLPDDLVGRAISWMAERLYNPPESVNCGTTGRAKSFVSAAQEILEAYDGREL